jgi:hypothetical protein
MLGRAGIFVVPQQLGNYLKSDLSHCGQVEQGMNPPQIRRVNIEGLENI